VVQQSSIVVCTHPGGEPLQESIVHISPSSQALSPLQQPPMAWLTQTPWMRLHASCVHGSPSSQSALLAQARQPGMGCPVHRPAWQRSPPVQGLPSEHAVPSSGWWTQPVCGLHESVVHGFWSSQLGGLPGRHTPLWQVSLPLQRLPSEHDAPLAALVCTQPVRGSQVSLVHGLPSLQFGGVPGWQTPLWQVSMPLQALPSEQAIPFATGVCAHPVCGLQVSLVHGF
jgi:hypothetical protein